MFTHRPPYILCYFADAAGCGHHRILRPLEHLVKAGMANGRADMNLHPDDALVAMKPDVVVFQRQHEESQIAAMEKHRQLLPDTFFVYEIDDILSAVPEWSIHRSYIPVDVDVRMARAIAFCDAVTVSTKTLGNHIKEICGADKDVRIVPNMLGRDELNNITEIRKTRRERTGKVRIGWGGGISHKADLDLLKPAIEYFKNRVEWVFLGMQPEGTTGVEFHQGVSPREYLPKFASLDLDLCVAPLVDCKFNQCKSNLRLIESGACGYPVIASRVTPYIEGTPPVFAYADNEEDWIKQIERFLHSDNKSGQNLQNWVLRRHVFDDKMEERLRGWLPVNATLFKPKTNLVSPSEVVIVATNPGRIPSEYKVYKTFAETANINADVLYLRTGTSINDERIQRMRKRISGRFASVSPLSNDGGVASFPSMGKYTPIDGQGAAKLDDICKDIFKDVTVETPFPAGPALLISRRALDQMGMPDDKKGEEEASLIEWGVSALARGWQNVGAADVYVGAALPTVIERFQQTLRKIHFRWPPINVQPDPLREVRAHLEMAFHKDNYKVPPLSSPNNYLEWTNLGDELGEHDKKYLADNPIMGWGSLTYPTSRSYIEDIATQADWIIMSRQGTYIVPQAKHLFDEAAYNNPEAVVLYADHDVRGEDGNRGDHQFKSRRFDYHMFLGHDYVTPICAIKSSVLCKYMKNRESFTELDSYDILLRIFDEYQWDGFAHVPWMLATTGFVKPEDLKDVVAKKIEVVNNYLKDTNKNIVVSQHPQYPQYGTVSYGVPYEKPKVSIIIVTGGRPEMLSPCVESLFTFTSYSNYELIIVTNKVVPEATKIYLDSIKGRPNVKIVAWNKPYNWSAKNNFGVTYADGEYYLFLNDDTRFSERDWLTEMVGAALCPKVGAVGAKLIYPFGAIQHVGVICHKGLTGHLHKMQPEHMAGYNGYSVLSHESTAVTGACLLVSKDHYDWVGGLDERYAHNFNDIAFCLELNKKGYRNVLPIKAMLQHLEGVTRTSPMTEEGAKIQFMEGELLGREYKDPDPYWNEAFFYSHVGGGFFVSGTNFDIFEWPRKKWPWRDPTAGDRVLMIGDDANSWVMEIREGNAVYAAKAYGYHLKIERPMLDNLPPLDIRDTARARSILMGLGVNKIVVASVAGGVIELLPFLKKLGPDVIYRPFTGESVCPRIDFKPNGASCDGGWRRGQCGACVESNNSPFGEVNISAWRDTWKEFLGKVVVDKTNMPLEAAEAMREVYGHV